MKRCNIEARPNWRETVRESGVLWEETEDGAFWTESMEKPAYYELKYIEYKNLKDAAEDLQKKCFETIDWLLTSNDWVEVGKWLDYFGIDKDSRRLIKKSWENDEWAMYGRFDFLYSNDFKLLEYNADTPTTLIESSVTQWSWFDDNYAELNKTCEPFQWNDIHESLVQHWADMRNMNGVDGPVHFSSCDQLDDHLTVTYMADCASEAGFEVHTMTVDQIGVNPSSDYFLDMDENEIKYMFKLEPWEWMMTDEGGKMIKDKKTRWIEPAWKMLLSNKALLPLLWHRYPGHPNLVASYMSGEEAMENSICGDLWVKKPLLSREGQNVGFYCFSSKEYNGRPYSSMVKFAGTDGDYDDSEGNCVWQRCISIRDYDGNYPMLGVWMVGEDVVGLGIREDDGKVTGNNSRFIPHIVV